ncbi:hypothetical protein [Micromonospora fulviviridis]|uniref:hypothetical protein n=1 Tax=Micromonospora fulviviridis TaxID=47860 RepID=UPI003790182A
MSSDDPAPEPPRLDRPFPGGPEEIPDWVRQLEREIRVGPAVRLRIWFRRHARRLRLGVGAVLVLALLAYLGPVGYRYARRPAEQPRAYPTISPPAGIQATTAASPPPAAGPFDGTPAAAFPEGAAGFTLPPARATGDFTAKQVSAALTKIRTALVTARLDRAFMTASFTTPWSGRCSTRTTSGPETTVSGSRTCARTGRTSTARPSTRGC